MTIFYFGADHSWKELNEAVGFQRRNTYILKALIENDRVDQVFVVHKTIRPRLFKLMKTHRNKNKHPKDIFFSAIIPDFFPGSSLLNKIITTLFVLIQTKYIPKKNDLLWCYWPRGVFDLQSTFLKGNIVFDTDHNLVDDPNLSVDKKNQREDIIFNVGQKAKWVLSGSRSMLLWYHNKEIYKTYLLLNGIELSRFDNILPFDFPFPKPIIGYIGVLSRWINYDWFYRLAQANPDWSFVIIGYAYKTEEHIPLIRLPNVYLLGKKNADQVPSIIKGFDVALGLYKSHPAIDGNSMKLYEYLAAGIPVVTTKYHQNVVWDYENHLHVAETYERFEAEIKNCLDTKEILPTHNQKKFLTRVTWSNRVDDFLKVL